MKTSNKNGYVAVAMILMVLVVAASLHSMIIAHRAVGTLLHSSQFEKGTRLDGESLRNLTTIAFYQHFEANAYNHNQAKPAGASEKAALLEATLEGFIAEVEGFATEEGSIKTVDVEVHSYEPPMTLLAQTPPDWIPYVDIEGKWLTPYSPTAATLGYQESIPRHLEWLLAAHNGPIAWRGETSAIYELEYPGRGEAFNWQIRVNADSWLVPLTNYPVVAYGQPQSGAVQGETADYAWLNSSLNSLAFRNANGYILMTSMLDGDAEDGVTNDFSASEAWGLPRMFLPFTKLSWQAYEMINHSTWRDQFLYPLAMFSGLPAEQQLQTVDMTGFWAAEEEPPGLSVDSPEASPRITIDLNHVEARVVNVITILPDTEIEIIGASATGPPVVVMIRNPYENTSRDPSTVKFSGDNIRPVLVYNDSMDVEFENGIEVSGALFLNSSRRLTEVRGNAVLYGHLSIDSFGDRANSYASAWALQVFPDVSVREALAAVSPSAYIVTTRVTY